LYLVIENFNYGNITKLPNLESGFTLIDRNNIDIALDHIRGILFDPSEMILFLHKKSGPDNDLNEKNQHYIGGAIETNATKYAFGERWGPEEDKPDKYFRFSPGRVYMLFI